MGDGGQRKEAKRGRQYLNQGADALEGAQANVLAALQPLLDIVTGAIGANPSGLLLNDQVVGQLSEAYRGQRLGTAQDMSNQLATRYAMPGNSTREGSFQEAQRRVAGQAAGDIGQFDAQLRMQQAQEVPGAAYVQSLLALLQPETQFAQLLANLWSGGAAGQLNYAGQLAGSQGGLWGGIGQGIGTLGGGLLGNPGLL